MKTNIKLSKTQIIQSGWILGFWLGKLDKEVVKHLSVVFSKK